MRGNCCRQSEAGTGGMLDSAQAGSSSAVTFLFAMTAEKVTMGRERRVRRSGIERVVIKPRG
jgi:hypothetical protein